MKCFKNAMVYVAGEGVKKCTVEFDEKILSIGDSSTAEEIVLPEGAIVIPGFVDQHIHGAGGSDGMDATIADYETIAKTVAAEGTTSFVITTMTQSVENITKAMEAVKEYQSADRDGARVVGIHLEGPFIAPAHKGAQPLEYVAKPDVEVFKAYNEASGNAIKIVTLAPEVEGSDELIAYLTANNIVSSIGHTGAKCADIEKAIVAGASNVTHTYNAQTALHHREIGTVGSAMLFDELNCELIADTIHVSVPAMKLLIKNKPADKVSLITDAMRAKGIPDGISELGGQVVYVKNGEARLEDGTLAGSVLRMNRAVQNVVTKVGVPFTQAVDFATINPAKNLKIDDKVGSIDIGKNADFAVLDEEFNVLLTIRSGKVIYQK
jgi:N-acetylglucosamine-6-phosphate deacetylase